jgi:hypothetical protein
MTRARGRGATLLLLVALPAAAPAGPALPDAQPRAVKVRAEKTTVRLGEPFGYEIEVRHAPEERYALRADPPVAPFEARDVRCVRAVEGDGARTTCSLQLALFTLGEVDVPELVLDVERPGGKARLAVPGPRITAAGMLDPSADPSTLALRDVAPPVPLLVRSLRLVWWAIGLAAAAGLVFAAVLAARRIGTRRTGPPPPTPAERFERRLDAIAADDLARRGRGTEHVERLAEAVREYLSAVTRVPALDLTTSELLGALARGSDPRIDLAALGRFLAGADLVKFARLPASPEACAAGMEFARALLSRTRPPPAAAAG